MDTFPNTKQKPESKTCGPVALLNIYTYFEKSVTIDSLLKDLNVGVNDSTYLPQLARHLNDNKLETIILTSNSNTISPAWKDLSNEQIISGLKKWVVYNNKNGWLTTTLFLLFYLQEGGHIKITDLSTSILDDYLDKGHIHLCCLEESWLWEMRKVDNKVEYDDIKGQTEGHFIVIYGKEGNEYLVSDSYPTSITNRDGLYKVNKQKLLIATLMWNQEFLAIKTSEK